MDTDTILITYQTAIGNYTMGALGKQMRISRCGKESRDMRLHRQHGA